MTSELEYWIESLDLQPHPEGGFYRETWRAAQGIVMPGRFGGPRPYGTAIYFLLPAGQMSALHRIRSDEMWHFYTGKPLILVMIHPDGRRQDILLGPDMERGQCFQAVVPAGVWFGARVLSPTGYALVGCTVSPGFDFGDFEMASYAQLSRQFPQHAKLIEAMTPEVQQAYAQELR